MNGFLVFGDIAIPIDRIIYAHVIKKDADDYRVMVIADDKTEEDGYYEYESMKCDTRGEARDKLYSLVRSFKRCQEDVSWIYLTENEKRREEENKKREEEEKKDEQMMNELIAERNSENKVLLPKQGE